MFKSFAKKICTSSFNASKASTNLGARRFYCKDEEIKNMKNVFDQQYRWKVYSLGRLVSHPYNSPQYNTWVDTLTSLETNHIMSYVDLVKTLQDLVPILHKNFWIRFELDRIFVVETFHQSMFEAPIKCLTRPQIDDDFLYLSTDGGLNSYIDPYNIRRRSYYGGSILRTTMREFGREILDVRTIKQSFTDVRSPTEVELKALKNALVHGRLTIGANNLRNEKIFVGVDDQSVPAILNRGDFPKKFNWLYRNIFKELNCYDKYVVEHVYRELNTTAHELAEAAKGDLQREDAIKIARKEMEKENSDASALKFRFPNRRPSGGSA